MERGKALDDSQEDEQLSLNTQDGMTDGYLIIRVMHL